MADPKIEDRSDAMEDDLHKLEDHIAEAETKLEARKEDAAGFDDVAGEPEGEQEPSGQDDADDPDEPVEEEAANPT